MKRKGTAGAVLKMIMLFVTFALFSIYVLGVRYYLGTILQNYNYQPRSPEETEILTTLDNTLFTLLWASYFILLFALAVEVFRKTTEGTTVQKVKKR